MDPTHSPLGAALCVATNATARDPAIDAEAHGLAKALEAYQEHLDLSKLPLRAGAQPTLFVLTPLRAAFVLQRVESSGVYTVEAALCFLAACHEIRDASGDVLRPDPRTITVVSHDTRVASDDWLETVAERYGLDTVYEMGRRALRLSKLPLARRRSLGCWDGLAATT